MTDPHVHRYRGTVGWNGSTGGGYATYDRSHRCGAPPAEATLEMGSDPAFGGNPLLLNPEQLLVVAAASCQLLSFLAVASRARIDVTAYMDEAEGEMPETDGATSITRITLQPRITVAGVLADDGSLRPSIDQVARLVELGHRECYIANSLRTEVVVLPDITVV